MNRCSNPKCIWCYPKMSELRDLLDRCDGPMSIRYVNPLQQWVESWRRHMLEIQISMDQRTVSTAKCTDPLPNSTGMEQASSLDPDSFIKTEGSLLGPSWIWVACGWVKVQLSDNRYPRIDLLVLNMDLWPYVPRIIQGIPSPKPAPPAITMAMGNLLPIGEVYVDSYLPSHFLPQSKITEYR